MYGEETIELKNINVSPHNPLFCCFDEKLIIGKSSIKSNEYDTLIFCVRNIKKVTIPSFIKIIGAYSFSSSSIESFTIPPNIIEIGERAFSSCLKLKSIEIPNNSELKTIEKNAFHESSIERLSMPSNLIDLKEGWCAGIECLTSINVSEKNPFYSLYNDEMIIGKSSINSEFFDILIFCFRNVEKVTIPNFIRVIDSYSFNRCTQLKTVEIPFDSNLQEIKKKAFFNSSIEMFTTPSHLTSIEEGVFGFCEKLKSIEIPSDSKLKTIKKKAFNQSSIECLSFPQSLIELEEGWCSYTVNLNRININENNSKYTVYNDKMVIGKSSIDSKIFDVLVFCFRDVEKVTLPSFIQIIDSYAFSKCRNLRSKEIPTNSELKIIN